MKRVKELAKTISGEMEETVKEILEKIYKVVNEDEKNEKVSDIGITGRMLGCM